MMVVNETFWGAVDAQIAVKRLPRASSETVVIAGASAGQAIDAPASLSGTARGNLSDWTGVLDNILAAKTLSEEQDARLRENVVARQVQEASLRKAELEIQAGKRALQDAQVEAETKMRAIQAEADARVRAIEGQAEARIRKMEERARAAEARAEMAEDWLARIEEASKSLTRETLRAVA